MQPDVVLSRVEKSFAGDAVVRGVDLAIRRGEFFSLLGPSGCGKTTTLRMIAGLEAPTGGSISIRGVDMAGVPIERRPTNLVFQKLALFPHLDVFDNIAFGLKLRKTPAPEIRRRVAEMLDIVRLSGFETRSVASLSGGQQQRVAIARAVVNEPAVLLLDEPLGALDLKLQTHLQEELRQIQRALEMTFVYVTHNQAEAMAMSDRIGVMNAGRLEQVGAPADLYLRPATRFVASFIGQTNLIDGRIDAIEDGKLRIEAGGLRFVADAHAGATVGAPATVSLRPEQIRLTKARDDGSDALVIADATFMGASVNYRLQGRGLTLLAQATGEAAPLPVGARVDATWLPDAAVTVAADGAGTAK
ncbi:MAG: ABC transporter ATP-binding protein [Rhizobiales bacterium]|nr:ABC transporter ATP-binding protein [Hyphomicrobiales bacterium]